MVSVIYGGSPVQKQGYFVKRRCAVLFYYSSITCCYGSVKYRFFFSQVDHSPIADSDEAGALRAAGRRIRHAPLVVEHPRDARGRRERVPPVSIR